MYIGQTSKSIARRYYEHKHNAFSVGKKTKLYDAMRKYGENAFEVFEFETYSSKDEINNAEIDTIKEAKNLNISLYNMTSGGDGGFVVPDSKIESWKEKLSEARQGRAPALGMKHSEENKKYFSEVSNKYWNEHRKYTAKDIKAAGSFLKAKELYGISKTHYYRLIKTDTE